MKRNFYIPSKMMKNRFVVVIISLLTCITGMAMEYGLRFNSHSFPALERTELNLGTQNFKFSDEISLGFEMAFYDNNCFGRICAMTGDDGTAVSLVSSAGNDGYYPCVVINDTPNTVPVRFAATSENPCHISLKLNRKDNKVVLVYGKEEFEFPADLSKMNSAEIGFGVKQGAVAVAPIEIQDIRVFTDRRNTHSWELRTHRGDSVYDDISGELAVAKSPHWLYDEHTGWSEVFSFATEEQVQTAFDPIKEMFYIVTPGKVTCFNPLTGSSRIIKTDVDGRAMKHSNYLTYDTLTNQLISYSPESGLSSRFDFQTDKWVNPVGDDSEPHYANHGYTTDGENAYMFGGYGFYMFHNNLVRMNLRTGRMESLILNPLPDPRTSSSLGVRNGKLYIFGGTGNSIGKQEVSVKNYFDLWEYDLSNMKGRKLWEVDDVKFQFLPSSSMYYSERDNCFYVAATVYGGCLMKIGLDKPDFTVVSDEIRSKMDYRDFVFNLYRTKDGRRYYLVIDKRLDDFSHDLAIYSIAYPFGKRETEVASTEGDAAGHPGLWWWIAGGAAIVAAAVVWLSLRRRKRRSVSAAQEDAAASSVSTESISTVQPSDGLQGQESYDNEVSGSDAAASSKPMTSEDMPVSHPAVAPADTSVSTEQHVSTSESKLVVGRLRNSSVTYYDRDKSAISFLGRYEIKDRNGYDITPKFSSRIKDLLILLTLCGEMDEKGVSYKKIDEEIWGDKDEKSAKNNRNVYMRKLRILLEEVGDVEVSYDKGYYRLDTHGVCFDYHEVMALIRNSDDDTDTVLSGERLERLVELLLHGPLLPGTAYDWLDKFKGRYTEISLHLLNKLLRQASESGDDNMAYRIAETMSLHDPLSEEALAVKCRILFKRNMKGPAKNVYDSFCSEYEKSLGEPYPVPFSSFFRPDAGGQN